MQLYPPLESLVDSQVTSSGSSYSCSVSPHRSLKSHSTETEAVFGSWICGGICQVRRRVGENQTKLVCFFNSLITFPVLSFNLDNSMMIQAQGLGIHQVNSKVTFPKWWRRWFVNMRKFHQYCLLLEMGGHKEGQL